MDEATRPQDDVPTTSESTPPLTDVKLNEAAARATVESLIEVIRSDAREAATAKESADSAKTEIVGHLRTARESVATLNHELEAARTSAAELTTLSGNIGAAHAQSEQLAKQATAEVESAKRFSSTASEIIGRLEGIRDEAVKTQATIAEKNEHIEGGLQHVASVRRHMEAALERATQSAESTERQHQASKVAAESITSLLLSSQASRKNAESDATTIAAIRGDVEAHAVVTKKLAETAEATDARVAEYQSQLTALIEQSKSQRKQIDELLAGATDAGLASAFDRRSKKFKTLEWICQGSFVLSLLGLVGLALWQAHSYQKLEELPDWQQVARMLAIKLPFAAPLVWLAVYSGRQASLAKQMEEEYAYKATVSMSFDGYRRQMAEIGKDLSPDSPLATLCNNTLREIAASPSRVYNGQKIDPNIATSIADALKPAVESGFKTLADKLPELKS